MELDCSFRRLALKGIENELLPITDDDVAFADERLKMHKAKPDRGSEP